MLALLSQNLIELEVAPGNISSNQIAKKFRLVLLVQNLVELEVARNL